MRAVNWISRGEASPPSTDPRIVVGGPIARTTVPNLGSVNLATGLSKLGWLNKLKNCSPRASFPFSQCGRLVYFNKLRSVSKYPGPRKLFRPRLPKPVEADENWEALRHG